MNGDGPDRRTASPSNSILRVPAGLTPHARPADSVVSPFTRPNVRLLFQIPISCGVSRVDSSEGTLSQMLGPPRIPTKLSAEAKSRPFEGPVITVRLPGESRCKERGRDIDKERRDGGGDSEGKTERARDRNLMIATFCACIGAVREPRE